MVEISVIIPVYNVEKYLVECLDSVINQTFKDIEIICVNDGSTDSSLNILKKYQNKYSRIKIFTQDNHGLSNARNRGFDQAQGKYIYFMDSDDYLELNTLEKIYSISEEKNLDLLIFKVVSFDDESGEENYNYTDTPFLSDINKNTFTYLDFKENLLNVDVTIYSKFFKKDLIKDYEFPEGLIFEDNTFYIDYILEAARIDFLDECLYHRRIRKNSIITKASKNHADLIEIYKIMAHKLKSKGFYDEYKEKLFNKKIRDIYFRFCHVKPEYTQFFYEKMKKDFMSQKDEYEHELDLNKIHDYPKEIFTSVINSKDYNEIESYMNVYTLKKTVDELTAENKKLKKKNRKLKQELSSGAGIGKSLKKLMGKF